MLPWTLLGAGVLWFGWFGFNAGSALAADGIAVQAFVNTNMAAAAAMLGWLLFEAGDHAGAARRFRRALEDPSARVRKSAVDGLEAIRKAGR